MMSRTDAWALPVLVFVGVVIPFAIAVVSGSLEIPHNDDFSYRRVAVGLYETGRVELTGWAAMSLVGHVISSQPFLLLSGGSPWSLSVMTALFAVVGLVASYVLVRPTLPAGRAVLAVLTVIVFPGFMLNTWTFMTDVPAYAAEIVCLVLGVPALRDREPHRSRWLVASLAVGVFGFSIREFALAAPAAVILAGLVTHGRRRIYVAAGIGLVVACGIVYVVATQFPGHSVLDLAPLSPLNVLATQKAFATVALGLSPVLVISAGWWLRRAPPSAPLLGGFAGVLVYGSAVTAVASGNVPPMLVGNLFEQVGALGLGVMAGQRPDLFPDPVWQAVDVIALCSAILLFALLGAILGTAIRRGELRHPFKAFGRLDPWTRLLLSFAALYGAGVTVYGLSFVMFDRYLWPVVLPLGALLLARPRWADRTDHVDAEYRRPGIATVVGAGLLGALSVSTLALLLNSTAFDAARWREGEATVQRGFARATVDAGFEWVGLHATGIAELKATQDQGGMWYSAVWPGQTTCALVSSSLLDLSGFTLEAANTQAYRLFLFAGPETPLYVYRVANPGCPQAP